MERVCLGLSHYSYLWASLSIWKHSVMAARITLTLQRIFFRPLDVGAMVLGIKVKTLNLKNNSGKKNKKTELSVQHEMMQQVRDALIPLCGRGRKSGLGNSAPIHGFWLTAQMISVALFRLWLEPFVPFFQNGGWCLKFYQWTMVQFKDLSDWQQTSGLKWLCCLLLTFRMW